MIENNKEKKRFQLEVENKWVFLDYEEVMRHLCINHTEVPKELGGRGLGSNIVLHALNYAKSKSFKVFPFCPFAAKYIQKHPEWLPMVGKGFKWNNVIK